MTTILERPEVQFETRTQVYTLRRLNLRDSFALGKIVTKVVHESGAALSTIIPQGSDISPEIVGTIIFACVPHAENEVYEFCGSLCSISADEFADMDLEGLPLFLDALARHDDLDRFLLNFSKVLEAEQGVRKLLDKVSKMFSR